MGGIRIYQPAILLILFLAIGSVVSFDLSSSTYSDEEILVGDSLSSSTSGTDTLLIAPDGRIRGDYLKESDFYSLDVKNSAFDHSFEVSANGKSLGFVPKNLYLSGEKYYPSFNLYSVDENNLSYVNIFGEDIDLRYEVLSDSLKEELIISEIDDSTALLSSSTNAVDFLLIYDETEIVPSVDGETEWDGESVEPTDDIYFIRKKEAGRIYLKNRFFKILKPFAIDSEKDRLDLSYQLYKEDGETHLYLNFPRNWLAQAKYPVTIDPTIEIDSTYGHYRFDNTDDCSTDVSDCNELILNPASAPYTPSFKIDGGCSSVGDAQKDIFQFDIEDLQNYTEDLYYANLHYDGDCTNMDLLSGGSFFGIYQVGNYTESSPTCSDNPFDNVQGDIVAELYGEGTSYNCVDVSNEEIDIQTRLQNAIDNNDDYIAFKLDFDVALEDDDDPGWGYSSKYELDDLYIEYEFTCYGSDDCLENEFCKDLSPDLCDEDLDYGDDCEDIAAYNEDDEACPHETENCQEDDFDNSGYFCNYDNMCMHNGANYSIGLIHCADDDSYSKTCQGDTTWTTETTCTNGCTEGVGCITTTTTSTTTTTLAGDINVNPGGLTFRIHGE